MKLIVLRFLIVISTICIPIAFISFITEIVIRSLIAIVLLPIIYICSGHIINLYTCTDIEESISYYILYPFIKLNKIYNNLK